MKAIWPFGDKGNKDEIAAISALADIAPTVGKEMMEIALRYPNPDLVADPKKLQQDLDDDLKKLQQGLGDDSKKPQQDVDVMSTNNVLSNLKSAYECQRDHIKAKFSEAVQGAATLERTFEGMSDGITKIYRIWLLLLKDSQTLTNKLSDMRTTKHELVFNQYATTLEATYEALQFSLEHYSLAVQT